MKTTDIIEQNHTEWTQVRRDIHAHPELRFEEFRTSALVARRLESMGIEVHTGIGSTGVVGVLHGTGEQRGDAHRRIGLRADMDALPMQERNTFGHASTIPGRMHACGHDGHVAMLLAAAQALAHTRESWSGTVVFIFQPAEEGGAGARRMMDDGLFTRFPVDAVFAMHNWPGIPEGEFAVRSGPMMASSNEFELVIRGKGAHAAMPDLGIDPVTIACQIVQAWQTLISRVRAPLDPAVISVTQIRAGEAINVIPETATLGGTVRTFRVDTLDMIESKMLQIADHLCMAYGAQATFSFKRQYPPLINDDAATRFFASVLSSVAGVKKVRDNLDPTMGAEDFAFMLQEIPGSYVWIGNGTGDHRLGGHGLGPCTLHNPSYDFNDGLIPLGARVWRDVAIAFLNRGFSSQ